MSAPRRIKTFYNGGHVGCSVTPAAAVRAAFRRILARDYREAQIIDEYGDCVAVLKQTGKGITMQRVRRARL